VLLRIHRRAFFLSFGNYVFHSNRATRIEAFILGNTRSNAGHDQGALPKIQRFSQRSSPKSSSLPGHFACLLADNEKEQIEPSVA
jgi:hypothetical protein